jgi:hypothetical protein
VTGTKGPSSPSKFIFNRTSEKRVIDLPHLPLPLGVEERGKVRKVTFLTFPTFLGLPRRKVRKVGKVRRNSE